MGVNSRSVLSHRSILTLPRILPRILPRALPRALLVFPVLMVAACFNEPRISFEEEKAVEVLKWLDVANAEDDANQAIIHQNLTLFSMGQRGTDLPGLSAERAQHYTEYCGIAFIPGATDAVRGSTHLQYLQRAHKYAAKYNQLVVKHCASE